MRRPFFLVRSLLLFSAAETQRISLGLALVQSILWCPLVCLPTRTRLLHISREVQRRLSFLLLARMLPCSLWVSTRRNTHQTFTLFLMLVALPTILLPLQRLRRQKLQADDRVEAIPKGSYHYGTKGKLPLEMMEPRVQENVKLGKKAIDPYDLAEKNACLPSELRCLIYTKYMKEAVIIPCCHQSFCERCIREVLTQKSKCPKCSSDKFKAEDVLPNLSLREAIVHFLEA